MIEEEENNFCFCQNVDIHALNLNTPINSVVAIAAEHGFRGILVSMFQLESLVKEINRPLFGDKDIIPICTIDYPFGNSTLDVRTYSIHSAREKGAKEVEIMAPLHLIANKDFRSLHEDAQGIAAAASKVGISVKYILDQSSPYVDGVVRDKLCKIISSAKIPYISVSCGQFKDKTNSSDSILKMRNVKNKTECEMKVFIDTSDANEFALYPKAGADIIGLDWKKAPYLVHEYEKLVLAKE